MTKIPKSIEFDQTYDSNDFFFISGIENSTFRAGKNSFTLNKSSRVVGDVDIKDIHVYDPDGNKLHVVELIQIDKPKYNYREGSARVFSVLVYPTTKFGVGRIEIHAWAWCSVGAEDYPPEYQEEEVHDIANEIDRSRVKGNGRDERFYTGSFNDFRGYTDKDLQVRLIWEKSIYFSPNTSNLGEVRFYDFPTMTVKPELYSMIPGPTDFTTTRGQCSLQCLSPRNGTSADYDYSTTEVNCLLTYVGSMPGEPVVPFDSTMEGKSIRLTRIQVQSPGFSGLIDSDFVATVIRVESNNRLLLDRPFTLSMPMASRGMRGTEHSPYFEETGMEIKAYSGFNETTNYTSTAKSAAGAKNVADKQVYEIGFNGISHRKNYSVCDITLANFEIVHQPRKYIYRLFTPGIPEDTGSYLMYSIYSDQERQRRTACVARVEVENLRTLTGEISEYKLYQRSLSRPDSFNIISAGPIVPNEVVYDWFDGADFSFLGKFYTESFNRMHWLPSSGLTYTHTPEKLMDSVTVTVTSPGAFMTLKANRQLFDHSCSFYFSHPTTPASGVTTSSVIYNVTDVTGSFLYEDFYVPTYTPTVFLSGSWWWSKTDRFLNFGIEPSRSFENLQPFDSASVLSAALALTLSASFSPQELEEYWPTSAFSSSYIQQYSSSIENLRIGDVYNCNFIKLTKNTMYEMSVDYSSARLTSAESVTFYFVTTTPLGQIEKIALGVLNQQSTFGTYSGTYKNKVFIPRTMNGTIQVEFFVDTITLANISVKPFRDKSYSIDSFELLVPITPKVRGERLELKMELFDSHGKIVYGSDANSFGLNRSLKTLSSTIIADPLGYTLRYDYPTGSYELEIPSGSYYLEPSSGSIIVTASYSGSI